MNIFDQLMEAMNRSPDDIVVISYKDTDDRNESPKSRWVTAAQAGAVVAEEASRRAHVWFSLQPFAAIRAIAGGGREVAGKGSAGEVRGVTVLYLDLDDKNSTLKQQVEMIRRMSEIMGSLPCFVIASGGGRQPGWNVEEVSAEGSLRSEGKRLLDAWKEVAIAVGHECGIAIDKGVFNLDRILRAPGTMNRKAAYGEEGRATSASFPGGSTLDAAWAFEALARAKAELLPTIERVGKEEADRRSQRLEERRDVLAERSVGTDGETRCEFLVELTDPAFDTCENDGELNGPVNRAVLQLVRAKDRGHRGVAEMLVELQEALELARAARDQHDLTTAGHIGEFDRMFNGAVTKVAEGDDGGRVMRSPIGCCLPACQCTSVMCPEIHVVGRDAALEAASRAAREHERNRKPKEVVDTETGETRVEFETLEESEARREKERAERKADQRSADVGELRTAADGEFKVLDQRWFCGASATDPMIVVNYWLVATGRQIKWWRDRFYCYSGGVWRHVDDDALLGILFRDFSKAYYIKPAVPPAAPTEIDFKPKMASMRELKDTLARGHSMRDADLGADRTIVFTNGCMDPTTGEMTPHSASRFCIHGVPLAYDPFADCPEWKAFLKSSLLDDDQIDLLQEVMGWWIAGGKEIHKIVGMWGEPRSGKSTIMRVMAGLLGQHAITAPSLSSISDSFGLQNSLDASLIQVNEARFNEKNKDALATLLQISGNDPVDVNVKNKPQRTVKLPGRVVMVSNEAPRVKDDSGVFTSRFVHLYFPVSFLGKEDVTLEGRLLDELAGIAAWALRGWERLKIQGYRFTPTVRGAVVTAQQKSFVSELRDWYDTRCEAIEGARTASSDLYASYVDYCQVHDVEETQRASNMRMGRFLTERGHGAVTARLGGAIFKTRLGITVREM